MPDQPAPSAPRPAADERGPDDGRLVAFLVCDAGGIVRGRSVPANRLERQLATGLGWVPANQSLTPFGGIADPNPFGAVGDLRILPDPATRVHVDLWPDVPPLDFLLCDIVETDGRPWDCCPRTFLRDALDRLRRETGLGLRAAFEHEFMRVDDGPPPGPFTLDAQRRVEPFAREVTAALAAAGVEPEAFLPEYGPHQFEVPCRPAEALVAADRSVVVKEVVREVARRRGGHVTFAPLLAPDGIGNGAHIHFSLVDEAGAPVGYDPARPGCVGTRLGSFAAGILAHLPALTAFAASSAVSYLRLVPHRWSAGTSCLGERNREAALRISPIVEFGGGDPAGSFNLEFRAADSTGNPYLALGMLVRAGLEGLRAELPTPPILDRDPEALPPDELAALSGPPLPTSLPEALAAVEADPVVSGFLPPRLLECFLGLKQAELDVVAALDPTEACRRYATVL